MIDGDGSGGGSLYVKVMTDEQLEILRTQIAAFGAICEQLVELHKSYAEQHDLAGVGLANPYSDPSVTSAHKITARQRWTPTPLQLHILECIFDQGTGTPSKQKIKEIAAELSQHGQISEANVYNWFQNRRARSKRKQQNAAHTNAEQEVEMDAESPIEMKMEPEKFFHPRQCSGPGADQVCLQSQGTTSRMHSTDLPRSRINPLFPSNDNSEPSESSGQISLYERMLQNPGIDHF